MRITETSLQGVFVVEPTVHGDHRGYFMETYSEKRWLDVGLSIRFVQDNHSRSEKTGTLRGLHYQLEPYAQAKLVRVVAGSVFDVAVDIRPNSPTRGQWFGLELSSSNRKQLYIPRGFAHGFCTLEDATEVVYKVDQYYSSEHDRGIIWNDPQLAIQWPTDQPLLSDKDRLHPALDV